VRWNIHVLDGRRSEGKGSHYRTSIEGPKGEQKCSYTLSLTLGLDWGGWSTQWLNCFTPRKEMRCPLYQMLSESQGQLDEKKKSHCYWDLFPPP